MEIMLKFDIDGKNDRVIVIKDVPLDVVYVVNDFYRALIAMGYDVEIINNAFINKARKILKINDKENFGE